MVSEIFEPTRNDKVTVGITSSVIINPRTSTNKRKIFLIRNTSDDASKIVTLHFGEGTAVAETGIVLRVNESTSDSSETGYECWQGAITAISAVAGAQLSIFER